jgi:sugar lactone lactonase YvrE
VTVYAPGGETVLRTIKKGLSYPGPFALVFDASGNLYVANEGGDTVPVYAPGSTKVLRTISGGMVNPEALAFDGSGNLYVANLNSTVTVYDPNSGSLLRTISQAVDSPDALAVDGSVISTSRTTGAHPEALALRFMRLAAQRCCARSRRA